MFYKILMPEVWQNRSAENHFLNSAHDVVFIGNETLGQVWHKEKIRRVWKTRMTLMFLMLD